MKLFVSFIICYISVFQIALGDEYYMEKENPATPRRINLPFAFHSEIFGAAVGYIYGTSGFPQKQSTVFGTAMAGTEGSAMLFLMGRDIRLLRLDRLFVDPTLSIGYFGKFNTYIEGNPNFPGQRAGSHDSDLENYVQGEGWDNLLRMRFRYLLPIGIGENQILDEHQLDRGLLKFDTLHVRSWNPLTGAKTYFEFTPFYRSIQGESDEIEDIEINTNGIELALYRDKRNWHANPSRGHSLELKLSRDFGWFESTDSWTSYQIEFDQYLSLGSSGGIRQCVLAFDFWAAYSPTWEVSEAGEISHRPPPFAGASLGGYWRMRGYPVQRFNDKAAIYYGLELRLIPEWNPFKGWDWLQKRVGIQWIQLVPFVEVGRVAPTWDLSDLHNDIRWDVGLGLRLWAKGLVIRTDYAKSDEDFGIQMMVGQPFQF